MKRLLFVLSVSLAAGAAHADALDHVAEGAALYGEVRPVALGATLKRLGMDQLPAVQRIKAQVGGIDIFDPALLAPTGLDVASPIGVAVEFSPQAGITHARLAATLRDASMFRTFFGAIAASGNLPLKAVAPDSPAAKLGVIATASPSEQMTAIARIDGEVLLIDAVDVWGKKALAPDEIARRYSTDVAKPFSPGRGARRLFASDTAIAVYADGRRFGELLEAIYRQDLEDDLKNAKKPARAAMRQKRMLTIKKCVAEWSHAPSTFDDLALALAADPREVRLTLGWGTQGESTSPLRFAPVDDGGVDVDFLARQAPVVGALFAASAAPFSGLKHTGIYQSIATVTDFGKRCGDQVNVGIALRGWPLVVAAGLAELNKPSTTQSTGLDLSAAVNMFGQLRNVVVVVRDATAQSAQFALSATFDSAAKSMLTTLLNMFGGGSGSPKSLAANRTPTVYAISNPAIGSFIGALETLPKGNVMFTFADSDESLQMAYRRPTLMPGATLGTHGTTPIAALHLDGGMVARLATNAGAGENAKPALDMMARLKRVDADLASDGDLFRLTVRAPLKQ